MTNGMTIKRRFRVRQKRTEQLQVNAGAKVIVLSGRIPRISRLMALAIRFDHLISSGVVADQADLARLGHVSRARLTQVMNLTNLAPDIQEQLLDGTAEGLERKAITERNLRPILAEHNWQTQRRLWLQ